MTSDQLQAVIEGRNPFTWALVREQIRWQTRLILETKLDRIIEVPPLPKAVTEELYKKLHDFNLRPVYFPDLDISEDFRCPGYIKMDKIFYEKIESGEISKGITQLSGRWVFADFSSMVINGYKPDRFLNDPIAPLIVKLRQAGEITKQPKMPTDSRFALTHDDWRFAVIPAIAESIDVQPFQVRLQSATEYNFTFNVYPSNFTGFECWQWFEDGFGSSSLMNYISISALANKYYFSSDDVHGHFAGRLAVDFLPD